MTTAAEVLSCGFSCPEFFKHMLSARGVEGELTESGLVAPGNSLRVGYSKRQGPAVAAAGLGWRVLTLVFHLGSFTQPH